MDAPQLTRTYLVRTVIVILLIALSGYALFQSRHLILGPIISLETPTDGSSFSTPLITIAGQAKNVSGIKLNDQPIFIDEEGTFREQLLLPEGYTIMTIKAEDRFGRSTEKTLHLVRN